MPSQARIKVHDKIVLIGEIRRDGLNRAPRYRLSVYCTAAFAVGATGNCFRRSVIALSCARDINVASPSPVGEEKLGLDDARPLFWNSYAPYTKSLLWMIGPPALAPARL